MSTASQSAQPMRLLFIGDVLGRSGRAAVTRHVPRLREKWALDFVVCNGENAAGGFGITEAICEEIIQAGVDCVTLGNHAFDQRETLVFIERQPEPCALPTYPSARRGAGRRSHLRRGAGLLVVKLMGRVFMDAIDDPFAVIERELGACPPRSRRRRRGGGHARGSDPARNRRWAHLVDGRVTSLSARIPMCPPPTHTSSFVAPAYLTMPA